jgi:hypothetical protein
MRALLAHSLAQGLTLHHLDVSTAFLASRIDPRFNIFVELPEAFAGPNGERLARLRKSLYGLRQAAHDWFKLQEQFILSFDLSFVKSKSEPCMYTSRVGDRVCVVLVYVDDYLVATNDEEYFQSFLSGFKDFLGAQKVKDLGTPSNLLQMGIRISGDMTKIEIHQTKHIENCMDRFGLANADCGGAMTPMEEGDCALRKSTACDVSLPYRELIGSLLWISRCTRPDISHSVAYLGQFSCNYDSSHFKAAKRVLKYLYRTRDLCLTFNKPENSITTLVVLSDADWASNRIDRKSMSGCITYLNGCPVNWVSKKQSTVALSSTESEVYAMSVACTDALHLWAFLEPLSPPQLPILVYGDNQAAKCIAETGTNSVRSKWYDTRVFFLRDWYSTGALRFHYLHTSLNASDALTKSLGNVKLAYFRPIMLGIAPICYTRSVALSLGMCVAGFAAACASYAASFV